MLALSLYSTEEVNVELFISYICLDKGQKHGVNMLELSIQLKYMYNKSKKM